MQASVPNAPRPSANAVLAQGRNSKILNEPSILDSTVRGRGIHWRRGRGALPLVNPGSGAPPRLSADIANYRNRTLAKTRPQRDRQISRGTELSLAPSVCLSEFKSERRGGLHERYNLHRRAYCGDYGNSVVPRIAL